MSARSQGMKMREPCFSKQDIAVIVLLKQLGYFEHRIAALFDVNQGRISEVWTGKRDENGMKPEPDLAKEGIYG